MNLLGITGAHGAGKTTLIEALVPRFAELGVRVGVAKSVGGLSGSGSTSSFDWDREGKDTARARAAGALVTGALAPGVYAFRHDDVASPSASEVLDILRFHFRRVDLVLAEGFREIPMPKVEVFRRGISADILAARRYLLAVYGDYAGGGEGLPVIASGDVEGVVGLTFKKIFNMP